jgi:hypothetical protein
MSQESCKFFEHRKNNSWRFLIAFT